MSETINLMSLRGVPYWPLAIVYALVAVLLAAALVLASFMKYVMDKVRA